jgi:hypothetical protein
MSKAQREKGKRGEREVVKLFNAHFSIKFERGVQARGGDDYHADIQPKNPNDLWPIHVEVKNQKMPNIRTALQQAIDDTDGRLPMAVTKSTRSDWLITMRATDMFKLLRLSKHGSVPVL